MARYIYEDRDWPNFVWDEAALARPLADVARRQGRLLGRMAALGISLREEASLPSQAPSRAKGSMRRKSAPPSRDSSALGSPA